MAIGGGKRNWMSNNPSPSAWYKLTPVLIAVGGESPLSITPNESSVGSRNGFPSRGKAPLLGSTQTLAQTREAPTETLF